MNNLIPDSQKLLDLLSQGKKLVAMVAPSFPADFTESQLVYSLKTLGFDRIVDLSLAIATVNKMYESLLSKKEEQILIAANCPATVSLIKAQFPELEKLIAPIFSPMVCMSKICTKKFPGYLNVFIGPCLAKKLEAKNYPNEIALALTYKEIVDIFYAKNIDYKSHLVSNEKFEDFSDDFLQIFPTPGGVKKTISEGTLAPKDIIVTDGPKKLSELLSKVKNGAISKKVRFLDVLFCKGGCIGGPGIKNQRTLAAFKERLFEYRKARGNLPLCSEAEVKTNNNSENHPV